VSFHPVTKAYSRRQSALGLVSMFTRGSTALLGKVGYTLRFTMHF